MGRKGETSHETGTVTSEKKNVPQGTKAETNPQNGRRLYGNVRAPQGHAEEAVKTKEEVKDTLKGWSAICNEAEIIEAKKNQEEELKRAAAWDENRKGR